MATLPKHACEGPDWNGAYAFQPGTTIVAVNFVFYAMASSGEPIEVGRVVTHRDGRREFAPRKACPITDELLALVAEARAAAAPEGTE
ncbi:MAG: hypothetical protein IPG45_05885 [Deltaproteobacteria bacterium]|nr:hypothetical protein [Deltaproteobacteria bacterium]